MEETKEKWYEVVYNTRLDKLVLRKPKMKWKLFRRIRKHKVFKTIVFTAILFSILNVTMIFSFLKILQNI